MPVGAVVAAWGAWGVWLLLMLVKGEMRESEGKRCNWDVGWSVVGPSWWGEGCCAAAAWVRSSRLAEGMTAFCFGQGDWVDAQVCVWQYGYIYVCVYAHANNKSNRGEYCDTDMNYRITNTNETK